MYPTCERPDRGQKAKQRFVARAMASTNAQQPTVRTPASTMAASSLSMEHSPEHGRVRSNESTGSELSWRVGLRSQDRPVAWGPGSGYQVDAGNGHSVAMPSLRASDDDDGDGSPVSDEGERLCYVPEDRRLDDEIRNFRRTYSSESEDTADATDRHEGERQCYVPEDYRGYDDPRCIHFLRWQALGMRESASFASQETPAIPSFEELVQL